MPATAAELQQRPLCGHHFCCPPTVRSDYVPLVLQALASWACSCGISPSLPFPLRSDRFLFPPCLLCSLPAGIGSVGLFLEDREKPAVNIFKQVEKKKLLSGVEKSGLLRWACGWHSRCGGRTEVDWACSLESPLPLWRVGQLAWQGCCKAWSSRGC